MSGNSGESLGEVKRCKRKEKICHRNQDWKVEPAGYNHPGEKLNLTNDKYGALLIFSTDQAESKWQEEDKDYVLSYGKDSPKGRLEIDLVTPDSRIG